MPKPSKKITAPSKPKPPIWLWALIAVGVVLVAFVVLQTVTSNAAPPPAPVVSGGPALQVDKEKVDFGNVTLGQTVEAKFEVTNVGDQPLRFTKKPYIEVVEGC